MLCTQEKCRIAKGRAIYKNADHVANANAKRKQKAVVGFKFVS
jgi:hypothetical protein